MIERIANWAKELDRKGIFLGKIIRLIYEICVSAAFQSAIHIIASIMLALFSHAGSVINYAFVVPFLFIYGLFIVVFGISNQHRKIENNITKAYETAYSAITNMLHEDCHNCLVTYNDWSIKEFNARTNEVLSGKDCNSTCFCICDALNELLQNITNSKSFRVMTFVRIINDPDKYYINAYSPNTQPPDANNLIFSISQLQQENNKPVHSEPFLNTRHDPIIYCKTEIAKHYKDAHTSRPTVMYIGIPCVINGEVYAALQITSYDESLMEATNINDFIDNVLMVFASYLKVAYSRQLLYNRIIEFEQKPRTIS